MSHILNGVIDIMHEEETIHALNPSNTKYIRSFPPLYILSRFIEYKTIIFTSNVSATISTSKKLKSITKS